MCVCVYFWLCLLRGISLHSQLGKTLVYNPNWVMLFNIFARKDSLHIFDEHNWQLYAYNLLILFTCFA